MLKSMIWVAAALTVALFAARAEAQEGLTRLTVESLEEAIRSTDWTLSGEVVSREVGSARRWVWPVTRDAAGGAVVLHIGPEVRGAEVEAALGEGGLAVARAGGVLLAVVLDGQDEEDARALLNSLLRKNAADAAVPGVFSHLLGARGEALPEPLPWVDLAGRTRADALNVALNSGWTLQGPPELLDQSTYQSVTYALADGGSRALSLTFYACHSPEIAKRVEAGLGSRASGGVWREGAAVLLVLSPEGSGGAVELLGAIRASR